LKTCWLGLALLAKKFSDFAGQAAFSSLALDLNVVH
jgi:hypothetical protein